MSDADGFGYKRTSTSDEHANPRQPITGELKYYTDGRDNTRDDVRATWDKRNDYGAINTPPPSLPEPRHAQHSMHTTAYGHPGVRKGPLIDHVTNSWKNEQTAHETAVSDDEELRFCDVEEERSCPSLTHAAIKSRRFRKMFLILVGVLGFAVWYWRTWVAPYVGDEWEYIEGFVPRRVRGTYGIANSGDFHGTKIRHLDASLIPGGDQDVEGGRRLVFVGDIHGCKDELLALLRKVNFNEDTDHLIATGDVVSKGPDNIGVLDELIRLEATSVRGNHEDRILEHAKMILDSDTPTRLSNGAAKDAQLIKLLQPQHLDYLRDMPLMLRIPALPLAAVESKKKKERITDEIIVVHAGLLPHVPLHRQDPYFVMNMRSIDHHTHVPSAIAGGKNGRGRPWFGLWNWYNERLSRGRSLKGFINVDYQYNKNGTIYEGSQFSVYKRALFGGGKNKPPHLRPQVVVYGHDSKEGLQIRPWSKGLDSACVAGGQLTAMVLDAQGVQEFVSVECQDYKHRAEANA